MTIAAAVLVAVAAIYLSGRAAANADRAQVVAEIAAERADSVGQVADSLSGLAEASRIRASVMRGRLRALPVPDTCVTVVAPRDSLIDTLTVTVDELTLALHARTEEADSWHLGYDKLKSARDKWWKPRIGIGPFLGVCVGGVPCAGVGVNLSWRLP